jgi:DNA-binding protein HU-beta
MVSTAVEHGSRGRSNVMRKHDIIRVVAKQTNKPETQVGPVVNAVFEAIQEALAEGDEVAISGFGAFRVVDRPMRPGYHPQSREAITIGARKTPSFRAGAAFRRAVAEGK